jgi:hypothetical protein
VEFQAKPNVTFATPLALRYPREKVKFHELFCVTKVLNAPVEFNVANSVDTFETTVFCEAHEVMGAEKLCAFEYSVETIQVKFPTVKSGGGPEEKVCRALGEFGLERSLGCNTATTTRSTIAKATIPDQ